MSNGSKIFIGYRALGFVCNHVPLSLRYIYRRNENLVVTAVGKSFHTYSCSKLNLLSVSGQHPDEISCLTSDAYLVFTSCKNIIYAWRRGTELKHEYKGPKENVTLLYPFGPHLLAAYEGNLLLVWDIKSEAVTLEIQTSITITSILHPSTYLNKILIGSHEGELQLWNLKHSKQIFTFTGWKSPVTVLEQAPAINVAAIGLESGDIYIHNLKFDETIMKFSQDWGPVTGISFRTDGIALMASASPMGHVAVWDLEKRRLHSEVRDAHRGSVTGMRFLPNEPLLITSSSDNSIKMWIFDLPDDGARLLRLREGHSAPPTKIKFYGNNGKNILSAGLDSCLRSFSTQADNLNKSLGQASFNRKAAKRNGVRSDPQKMVPIVDFASESTREKDWDNVAAVHRNSTLVTTWSYDRSCMGKHKLVHDRFKGSKQVVASCLTISSCGNFVLIGYSSGHIDQYNIQSGIYRGSYGEERAHEGSVRGISLDELNQFVISGGSDQYLKFWKFKDHTLIAELKLEYGISKMLMHRESTMLAIALDDFSIIIVDIQTKIIVRVLSDNEGAVSDMTFSPDSRWLICAMMDSSIKTWDLPTGKLIDWFIVSPVCVSISLSPTGEYLATSHAGSLGIYLWANSTLFANVTLYPLPPTYDPLLLDLPLITLDAVSDPSDSLNQDNEGTTEEIEMDLPEFKSPEQISDELVTFSLLPQSHWLSLLDLDLIKMRNKPKEPIQVPKHAPFFLPTVSSLQPTFLIDDEKNKNEKDQSHVLKILQHTSEFATYLRKSAENGKLELVVDALKVLPPSKIDSEILCLSPNNGGSMETMKCFLLAMQAALKSRRNFELVLSYLALFLQIHYETVSCSETLKTLLSEIQGEKVWESLQEKINFCLCLGNYARSAAL